MVKHSFEMVFLTKGLLSLFLVMLHTHKSMAREPSSDRDLYYTRGQNVTFHCSLPMDTSSRSWRYYSNDNDTRADLIVTGDKIKRESQYHGRSRAVTESHTYTLTITNLNLNDTGRYRCSGRSRISEYRLYVLADRHPHCRIVRNTSNQSVILTCDSGVERNYPDIRWFSDLNGSPLASGTHNKTLKKQITLSEEDEHAEFKCVIGTGDVTSLPSCSVNSSADVPTASIRPSVARGNIGGAVNFTCTGSTRAGNISVTWDNETLLRFQGRYEVSDSELRIRNLKATDHETNVVCIARANHVGTEGEATATLVINTLVRNEYSTTVTTDITTEIMITTRKTESLNFGFGVGLIVTSLSVLLLVTLLIYAARKRYHFYQVQSGPVDDRDYVTVRPIKLGADAVALFVTSRGDDDQEHATGSYDLAQSYGLSIYDEVNGNPTYHVLEQTDDDISSVYAELNYHESKLETTNHQGVSPVELLEGENTECKKAAKRKSYVQEDKKVGEKCETSEDSHTKTDVHYNQCNDIADIHNTTTGHGRKQPSAPRYSIVVKSKNSGQQSMFEVSAEPTASQRFDRNDGSENFAQSVQDEIGSREYSDEYAEPLFDCENTVMPERLLVGNHGGTESEYTSVELTNDGDDLEVRPATEISLSAPLETLQESQYPASSIYAEIG